MVKLDHLAITVRDYHASRDWYVGNLGLRVEFEVADRRTVALQDDAGLTLFLAEEGGGVRPAPSGSIFLTFQVADVNAKYRELAARGIGFTHVPQKLFWGYGAELLDPDGYRIGLWDEASMRKKGGAVAE
jgi:catechol 2,3-dioxygenase-like lactoylglutathione lyase family enzyme